MNGIKLIVFSIISSAIAFAILIYYVWNYSNKYIVNERQFEDILNKIETISQFPQYAKLYNAEIKEVIDLINLLQNPLSLSYINQIETGIVPKMNFTPYLTPHVTKLRNDISKEIQDLINPLKADITKKAADKKIDILDDFLWIKYVPGIDHYPFFKDIMPEIRRLSPG
jgi:hypothetical protein